MIHEMRLVTDFNQAWNTFMLISILLSVHISYVNPFAGGAEVVNPVYPVCDAISAKCRDTIYDHNILLLITQMDY